jgi:hypothetical protein
MAVNTSVSPYFDDFDETKNYVKILFKPGFAVQARELTQTQSILQNQVKAVGNFLFSDGAKVRGPKPSVNENSRTIKLKTTDALGIPINLQSLLGTYVTSADSEVLGIVEFVYEADDPNIGDPPSVVVSLKRYNTSNAGMFNQDTQLDFYLDYTDALNKYTPNYTALTATDITKNAICTVTQYSTFVTLDNPSTIIEVGDLLVHPKISKLIYVTSIVGTQTLEISEPPGTSFGSENISFVNKATNPTTIFTQDTAVFYKSGYFITCVNQKIVPDKRTAYPTKLIAFLSDQQIITSDDDPSLLDPALESSNYFASGADRLKIDLNLASLDLANTTEEDKNLIPLLVFNKGKIEYNVELSNDAELDKKLAERTYDESGSYVVDQFQISADNTLEANVDMRFKISPGKAYVGGYQVKTVDSTEILVPKPGATETKLGFNVNTTYGNYFRVNGLSKKIISPSDLVASSLFLELHNVENPTSSDTLVGTITYKNIEYDSYIDSVTGTVLKLFFHDYSPVKEASASWSEWAFKYNIPVEEGQYIASELYTTNALLGNFGAASTPYYGIYREPDTGGLAYWHSGWVAAGKDISKIKENFVFSIPSGDIDYDRVRTSVKTYLERINNSPFYDGLLNTRQIRSIVGVANNLTSHGTSATYSNPFFYAKIAASGINTKSGEAIFFDSNKDTTSLISPISKSYIKTLDRLNTNYTKVVSSAVFSSGTHSRTVSYPETFALGDGVIPASTARANFIVLVKTGATVNVPLGVFNFENGTVTISSDATTVNFDLGDPTFTGLCDIAMVIENNDVVPRTKTLVENHAVITNVSLAELPFSLGVSDIVSFNGVYKIDNVSDTTWADWATEFGIPEVDGRYIAAQLYETNALLGNFGTPATAFYGLYREPDTEGVAYWYNRWIAAGSNINAIKEDFALAAPFGTIDYARTRTSSKTFLEKDNNSPFYDGLSFKYQGQWNSATSYTYDDLIVYGSAVYKAIAPSANVSPTDSQTWILMQQENSRDYNLDNGQRDQFYDHGTITYVNRDIEAVPPGQVLTVISYFTHAGEGPVTVESYPANFYSSIPVYKSVVDAKTYNLRDCLDFRPRRVDGSKYQNFDTAIIPNSTVTTEVDVTYYIGRKDRIYVTNTRQNFTSPYDKFYVEVGKESVNPEASTDNSDLTKLSIATLDIPPYAINGFDVKITYEDNKRFTMRDIAKLENLAIDLDRTVKLQTAELAILKSIILDTDQETELLKSGILVENFDDFNTADLASGYFTCVLDNDAGECYPGFDSSNIDMLLVQDTDIYLFNDIITKKYVEEIYVSNLEANSTIAVNPGGIDDGKGRAKISKSNSFAINMLLTGAALYGLYEYFKGASWLSESTLAVVWETARTLGYTVLETFTTIDGFLKMVSWPYRAATGAIDWIYGLASGSSSLTGSGGIVSAVGQSVFGQAAWGAVSQGSTLIADALASIFNQSFSATLTGVSTGIGLITSGLVTATWGSLAAGASSLAAATTGIPILGTATAAIASSAASITSALYAAGPFIQVVAVVALAYAAVKVGQWIWKGIKSLFSDERMKENIRFKKKLPNGLRLYEFEYKKQFKGIAGHGKYLGFMAQDVEKLYPNAVKIESNGYKSINYSLIGI